jgi:hypothetical protein
MPWLRSLIRVSALGLVLSSSAFAVAGQTSSNGSIRGYVHDPSGAAVAGATVSATSPDAPTPFTSASDAEGYYRLLDLPPGEYTLTAEEQGFAKFVRPGVAARVGLNLNVDINLMLPAYVGVCEAYAVRSLAPKGHYAASWYLESGMRAVECSCMIALSFTESVCPDERVPVSSVSWPACAARPSPKRLMAL